MNDQVSFRDSVPARSGRTIVLLVDCLQSEGHEVFGPGSEGLFLLRLASLLASGSGGRVLLYSVLTVPEGQSISAFSTNAQALRREMEGWAMTALASPASPLRQEIITSDESSAISLIT